MKTPDGSYVPALVELRQGLDVARVTYMTGKIELSADSSIQGLALESKNDELLRDAVQNSLSAVIRYIQALPNWDGLHFALIAMLEAISDIENGHDPSWLKKRKGGRSSKTVRVKTSQARLAGVMDYLIECGYLPPLAADYVFRKLDSAIIKKLGGTTRASGGTVNDWRDAVTGVGSDGDVESFNLTKKLLSELNGSPEERSILMIRSVEQQLR